MPGELGNCLAGRIANLFNLHGPNFTTDAACASALGRDGRHRRRTPRPRVRRRDHGWHRPQHGRAHVRQVLRDRRALPQRHPPVLGGGRRLRDGRRRRAVRGQAARRCRPRRGSDLRRGPRGGELERWQGQGHHRPQPGWAALRHRAGLAERGAVARGVHARGGPRDLDERGRRGRAEELDGGLLRGAAAAWIDRPRLGEVELRPPQRSRGSGGHAQGHARASRQGAAAEHQLRATQSQRGLDRVAVRRQHRAPRLGHRRRALACRGRQRVRLRRHQLPHRHGGVRAGPSRHQRPRPVGRRPGRAPALRRACPGGVRQAARARRARARRGRRGRARQRAAHGAGGGAAGPPSRSDAAVDRSASGPGADRDRLRRRPRPGCEGGAGVASLASGQPVGVAGAARPRHPPRQRHPGQGGVPLHGPGLAVREHARRAAPAGAGGRRRSSRKRTRSWRRCSRAGACPT